MIKRIIALLAVLTVMASGSLFAQRSPMPYAKIQFFDRNGHPCAGCRLWSFTAGTTSPTPTYQSSSGAANTNPVIADSAGRANIWLSGATSYKLILEDATTSYLDIYGTAHGVLIWSVDNITDYGAYLSAGGSIFAGDVTGAYDSTVVAKIQGVAVSATTPTAGQVLVYGSQWAPGAVNLASAAAITGVLPTANGGNTNGFFKVAGPASSEKTFTFPNASSTVLTTNALVTSAQGGTGNGFTKFTGPTTSEKTFTLPDASGTIPTVLTGSATLDFASTLTLASAELTITVAGAAAGDVVALGVPVAAANNDSCYTAYVSTTDTVAVRFNNFSAGSIDPASATFKVTVFK
jgi:hypothetical protein